MGGKKAKGFGRVPRKAFQRKMYVENALLRESRKMSHARNKYITNMLENISVADKVVQSRKSNQSLRAKEHKLGVLTPLATNRFVNTDFSNPESIDPRLKTLSAAGLTTSTELQLINKELGIHHRQFLRTEMREPKMKLMHIQDPNNKALKSVQKITQNLTKLNAHSQSNWSQRDLTKKLLSAPSNISRNYEKDVNTSNNETLILNELKPHMRYDDVASGSPVKQDERLSRLRKEYGFIDRNNPQIKTLNDKGKSTNPKETSKTDNIKILESNTARALNQDQKINYLILKESKHKKTDVLGQKSKKPPQKLNIFMTPFKTTYNCNSQSNIIWSDFSKPKHSETSQISMNGRSSTIDPLNPMRALKTPKKLNITNPKVFKKINGISEFHQITHSFNSNANKDYLKALAERKHFRRPKGMCSEFAKLSQSQPR
ncbi:unnamed protein product [Moneuplotes crassus]|uniref:Uncharacterized protein n=1 Tax=Euplotes crassus TaxID=5936 RepID=A0AAD1UH85_EUPCR|nr:unnamed protein product [Moneuplotes crassus]